jgi:hypothetical protein
MLYEVNNRPDTVSETLFFRAVDHCCNLLTLPSNLFLEINFINRKGQGGGTIGPDTDDKHGQRIELEINNRQSFHNVILTLFHEMKHVEQFANGDLIEGVYKGIDTREYEYGTKPHEQEAWEFEKETMVSFLEIVGQMGNE